jgi:NADH-quinone oxidoreductase subunit N
MRRKNELSAEAAFKYVVSGSIASAFILFGMSYLYGVTGSVTLNGIREALPAAVQQYEAFVYVGFGMMLAGFGVKIAAAPFHAWSLDVYQGAPTPIAALLAVVSKGAALAVVLRIFYSTQLFGELDAAGNGIGDDLFFAALLVAAIAMLVGTLAALRQKQTKRLLALSGVANAGYMLVPIGLSITAMHSNNVTELIFYLAAYLLMTIGAFAVVTVVSHSAGHEELKGFAGMYYRAPWTAGAMVVFVLSLAGLPVTAGFFGKLFILLGAANAKAYWIVAAMVLSSVISYYFYFGLIRQMFMRSGSEEKMKVPLPVGLVIWFCAAGTLLLGVYPGLLVGGIDTVFSFLGDMIG